MGDLHYWNDNFKEPCRKWKLDGKHGRPISHADELLNAVVPGQALAANTGGGGGRQNTKPPKQDDQEETDPTKKKKLAKSAKRKKRREKHQKKLKSASALETKGPTGRWLKYNDYKDHASYVSFHPHTY